MMNKNMGQDGFFLRDNLSNTFSALTVNSKLVKEDDIVHQIETQEQEIIQLRRHLAEYAVKEAQIRNEQRVLENRIGLIHKAFDQEQQDLVEASLKAAAYRQGIIEENIRLGYALQVAQEERSVFISSLVTLLADQSIHPADVDAVSIVSSLRILFKHNKERLTMVEKRVREAQYQPLVLHTYKKETPLKDLKDSSPETVNMVNGEDVVNSNYLPSILEEEHEQEQEVDESEEDEYDELDGNANRRLPTIEGLQILGEPYPGNEIQASGYSRNGATHCGFEWVRHMQDGSFIYIEGAKEPTYIVTADDVDNYLSVEVQPLGDRQRKGDVVRCFANDHKKIACHPDMIHEIERTLILGQMSFKLFVWIESADAWKPAILEIKMSGYSIKLNGPENGVVVDNKYTPKTDISLLAGTPLEFAILGPDGVEQYLCTDYNSTDIRFSRDTIVLTMRLFVKRAVDKMLGKKKQKKKKRRVLFFK